MSEFFQAEASLAATAPSYIERPADAELLRLCRDGRLAHVLAPRQSGKSSLVLRTQARLRQEGVNTAYVDLQDIGAADSTTPDQWYLSLAHTLAQELGLGDYLTWWRERSHLTPVKRFTDFLRHAVRRLEGNIVVFVDEIEFTHQLPFSGDDFFTAIRGLYNARASEPELERLSFVLIGVAAPSDLVKDPRRTPFNVGQGVELEDLDRQGARALLAGLQELPDAEGVLDQVLEWTSGHPRLTQMLCREAAREGARDRETVDRLVRKRLFEEGGENDITLREVKRQVREDPQSRRWLPLYRRVLQERGPLRDDASEAQTRLRLAGLVRARRRQPLERRNRVYSRVFNEAWVRHELRRDPRTRLAMAATATTLMAASVAAFFAVRSWIQGPGARQQLLEQLAVARPVVALSLVDQLVGDLGVEIDDVSAQLQKRPRPVVAQMFEEGADGVAAERRPAAVLSAAEAALPLVRSDPWDFRLLASVVWALDAFAAPVPGFADRAPSLRHELLAPLRAARPPPSPPPANDADWAHVPPGTFEMGSPEGVGNDDERPRHPVTVDGFRLLRHEVTNGELRRLVPDHDLQAPGSLPAVNVSWYTAYAYAAWLGGRLPTEAEWEYAARAGTTSRYWSGDTEADLRRVGFYWENSRDEQGVPRLQEGKQKEPNPWGLHDMHGNAWEWVADWYGSYSPEPVRNPQGPESGVRRVIRGGAFFFPAYWARSACRDDGLPRDVVWFLGFRVLLPLPPELEDRS